MQLISCHDGKLLKVDSADLRSTAPERSFSTGLAAVDELLAGGVMARGVAHEVLWKGKREAGARPLFFAAWVARRAAGGEGRIVWCDPRGEIYPPALASVGISLGQIFLLRPKSAQE